MPLLALCCAAVQHFLPPTRARLRKKCEHIKAVGSARSGTPTASRGIRIPLARAGAAHSLLANLPLAVSVITCGDSSRVGVVLVDATWLTNVATAWILLHTYTFFAVLVLGRFAIPDVFLVRAVTPFQGWVGARTHAIEHGAARSAWACSTVFGHRSAFITCGKVQDCGCTRHGRCFEPCLMCSLAR